MVFTYMFKGDKRGLKSRGFKGLRGLQSESSLS